jgi:hypothetical protein
MTEYLKALFPKVEAYIPVFSGLTAIVTLAVMFIAKKILWSCPL